MPYWSLSRYLKLRVKRAVSFISDFERALAREARRRGVDGVVCGHIHHAELRDIDGVLYANDGDWVESLTALVEHFDGQLQIIDWSQHGGDTAEPERFEPPRRARRAAGAVGAGLSGCFAATRRTAARMWSSRRHSSPVREIHP